MIRAKRAFATARSKNQYYSTTIRIIVAPMSNADRTLWLNLLQFYPADVIQEADDDDWIDVDGWFVLDNSLSTGMVRVTLESNNQTDARIERSEQGKRDLIPLHRMRSVEAFSKNIYELLHVHVLNATRKIKPDDILDYARQSLGSPVDVPMDGVFEASIDDAKEAIVNVVGSIDSFKSYVLAQRNLEKARGPCATDAQRAPDVEAEPESGNTSDEPTHVGSRAWWRDIKANIEAHCARGAPHSRALCDVLDGLHGDRLRRWAENALRTGREGAAKKIREDLLPENAARSSSARASVIPEGSDSFKELFEEALKANVAEDDSIED